MNEVLTRACYGIDRNRFDTQHKHADQSKQRRMTASLAAYQFQTHQLQFDLLILSVQLMK